MNRFISLESPFIQFLSRIIDLVILNFLFILFSLPIFTIGSSISALYTVSLKLIQNKDPYIFKEFITAFKRNFKEATIIWIIMLVSGILLILDIKFLVYLSGLSKFFIAGITATFGFVYLSILPIIFPYVAKYKETIKGYLIKALLIGTSNIFYTIILLLVFIIPFVLTASSPIAFLTGLYIFTFGGFAFMAFIHSFIINKVFSKYEMKKL